jgi:hypothetical protein
MSLCVLLLAAPVFADQTCKPVEGHFEAAIVPPGQGHCPSDPSAFCTAGRVWGGIQGDYQFVIRGILPSTLIGGEPTVSFFTGDSTVFLKSGDQLHGIDTGSIDFGQGGFASLITFHVAPDPLAATLGQIRLRGEFSAADGTTKGDYLGTLCSQ